MSDIFDRLTEEHKHQLSIVAKEQSLAMGISFKKAITDLINGLRHPLPEKEAGEIWAVFEDYEPHLTTL